MANSVPPNALSAEAVYGAVNVSTGTNATLNPCLPYLQVGAYELWASTTNDRTAAVKVATSAVPFFVHTATVQQWYWTKTVDASGNASDFYPNTTTSTVTATPKTAASLDLSLTAYAIVLPADQAGVVSSFSGAVTTAKVLDGATDVSGLWTITATQTATTWTKSGNTWTLTAAAADSGYLDVQAVRSGYPTLTARATVSKAKTGSTGPAGASAPMLHLIATSQVFQITKAGANSPASITFTAELLGGLTGSPTFSVTSGTATLTGSGLTRTLTFANLGSDTATIQASLSGSVDQITVAKLREGTDGAAGSAGAAGVNAVTALLSNEAHTLQANSAGTVSSFTGANTTITIYEGITDTSASWTVSKTDTGVTSTLATRTVTITAMSADQGFVDIQASRSGYATITKRFTLSKSKAGAAGTDGATGDTGPRGSKHFYVSGHSVWSDTAANTASNVQGGKQLNDIVTLYNSTSFSQTKFWNGSAWATISQAIDGNLLISGSVGATQISASYIYSNDIDATQVTSGTFTGRTFQTSASGTRVVIDATNNYLTAYNSSGVVLARIGGTTQGSVYSTNDGLASQPAIYGWSVSAQPGILGIASSSGDAVRGSVSIGSGLGASFYVSSPTGGHGLRGTNDYLLSGTQGGSGLVGVTRGSGGFAVYAERGGYGPFTGQHDALLLKTATVEPGDIVVDVKVIGAPTLNDVITHVERSSAPNQPTCVGVFVNRRPIEGDEPPVALAVWELGPPDNDGNRFSRRRRDPKHAALPALYDLMVMSSVGEGMVNVCGEGGDIAAGDLIVTSSTPGKGMKQADDIVRSRTVAKAREGATFQNANQVRQIACIYLCG
jgi:hypothetical protein